MQIPSNRFRRAIAEGKSRIGPWSQPARAFAASFTNCAVDRGSRTAAPAAWFRNAASS